MAIWENLKGLARSLEIRSKEKQIGRDAVYIGRVESTFLSNYETFKVGLISWIEHILIDKGNRSLTVRPKPGTDASKFLRYTLEDPSIAEFYAVEQRTGGEFVYRMKEDLNDLGFEEDTVLAPSSDEDENTIYI